MVRFIYLHHYTKINVHNGIDPIKKKRITIYFLGGTLNLASVKSDLYENIDQRPYGFIIEKFDQ